jgi:uncharacterized protein YbgA (DUF1722 family)/uncharacterized protein YbbK (DUF523 family)
MSSRQRRRLEQRETSAELSHDEFVRPVVVISECLEFEPVRYNGVKIPFDLVRELDPHVSFRPICPEVQVGLGVPRDPIRLVRLKGARVAADQPLPAELIQPSTGRDVTRAMTDFSDRFLGGLDEVDGFVLKSRSPSCGVGGVKVFADPDAKSPVAHRAGMFASEVLERFGWAAIEEEGRLLNYRLRHHFLTKLFALARLREVEAAGRMRDLVSFQARHKLLLMAHHQARMRALGRLVANADGKPFAELVREYRILFGSALARPARVPSVVNVLEHAYGYVSKRISAREKQLYRRELSRYRSSRIPLGGVVALVYSWAVRFEVDYLLGQAFFEPYPEALMNVSDSGKGRARGK